VQHQAELALARAVATTGAKSASAVVLDVASANVLAMAIAPPFNAHEGASTAPERRRNRIVTDWVEPGSTLKPLVVAAALDAGAVEPKTRLYCEQGHYAIRGHTVSDTHPHKWLTLTEVLAKSSNIGMAKISERFARPRLDAALRDFGFGAKSGIECPGEVAGSLRPHETWSDLEAATIAFGQGMAVNLVQLAAAYRVLAADGEYRQPRLVETIRRGDGQEVRRPPQPSRAVVSVDAARRVTRMLEAAIMPSGGTGRLAAVDGFRVAGKTGTAQKADPQTRGYSRDKYVALFAGYLPAESPRAVIVVAVDEPKTNHYGGVVAAPVFAEIGAATMSRLGVLASGDVPQVPPSKAEAAAMREEPAPLHPPVDQAIGSADEADGPAAAASPRGLPSFLGLTPRQATERFVALDGGAELRFSGDGREVIRQEPAPGTLPHGDLLHLVLGDKGG
jgi:cell division protein FtsI (penicillin-binding protein 3)